MLEPYNRGNHGEERGAHYRYEDYKIKTPQNSGRTTPNEWVKLIDRNLYSDVFLNTNPVFTVRPPAVKKLITTFLLYSTSTDSELLSAIVTLRANLYADGGHEYPNRFGLDVLPLTAGDDVAAAFGIANGALYDLLRLYVDDKGDGSANIKLFVRYRMSYQNFTIKVLHTSLNDYSYGTNRMEMMSAEYSLYRYEDVEYYRNQWLWIDQAAMSLVPESNLPTAPAKMYSNSVISSHAIVDSLPTAKSYHEGKVFTVLNSSRSKSEPYICYRAAADDYRWRSLFTYTSDHLYATGPAGTVRGIRIQTDGIDRWVIRAEGDPELGGNTGSSFVIYRRDDTGNLLGQTIIIDRATGNISMRDGALSIQGSWQKPLKMGRWYRWINDDGSKFRKADVPPTSPTDGVAD
ncbi:hypothetical protein [Paenibacillus humicus]|uniref:hypothetical protein n=1 Tax=Paenibacillus humicus TaxID=412861 RepID=UPI000FD6EB0F|nr:hypothetical protein [Paenibacillus humicus]